MADESLFALVLAQARATPDATAVRQWERAESYASLLGRAGALAATLPAGGTGLVGVCTERGVEMVVAVLGCWAPALATSRWTRRTRGTGCGTW
ncbi:hypothetical protein Athai_48700 [Actinocatenispora thailandica]|uniref:AMP-dependent synthetase/ligase domain-containing protein n=1 Tax=Actinocatenispora thailandica TaxID=227318 RepID=A0A7R7DTN9_9ACTN|nr:hypothetical protein [Actinocatenispora thailandica]BCJ37367.1 hypothetical protein Athai_48700 [Actinocatenispora thailandica]